MTTKYHTKLSQKATYLRVYEGERMLYGEEVSDVIKGLEGRIAELEKGLFNSRALGGDVIYITKSELAIRDLRQRAKGIIDLFRKHYHHDLSATGLKIWAVREELMLLEKSSELEKGE